MKVKVYSTPVCPECKVVKSFLEALNIDFEEVNAAGNQKIIEYLEKKTGQRRVPVIETEEDIVVGFNQKKLKQALHLPTE
ncbi:glutaredoxin family protein [Candidatus Woesearchaeota archaeon]|nr:glutaredoxin family protein [Candidatus Woesearchaeota archaeon]